MTTSRAFKRISLDLALAIICCVIGCWSIYSWYSYISTQRRLVAQVKKKANSDTKEASQVLADTFGQLKVKATELADHLSKNKVTKEQLVTLLSNKEKKMGLGVLFAPHAFDQGQELYAPYNVSMNNKDHLVQLESVYDYTKTRRYTRPLAQKQSGYSDSYLDMATNTVIVEYLAPFFDDKGNLQGVVFATYKAETIKDIINDLAVSSKGFVTILQEHTGYLYHPNRSYMLENKPVLELEKGNALLAKVIKEAAKRETGSVEGINDITQQMSWIFYAPIKDTPWTLVSTFIEAGMELFTHSLQHDLIRAVLSLLLLFVLLLLLVVRMYFSTGIHFAWTSALVVALCCLLGTSFIWYLAAYYSYKQDDYTILDSQPALQKFLDTTNKSLERGHRAQQFEGFVAPNTMLPIAASEPDKKDDSYAFSLIDSFNWAVKDSQLVQIPVGFYISEIDLNSILGVNKVKVSGIVWQRFKKGKHDDVSRGVFFPQALESDFSEIYKTDLYDEELIAWQFVATLAQQFDSKNYPFDGRSINIRIFSKDFSKPIILVPDLSAYNILTPTALAQLTRELPHSSPEWYFEKSFFFYKDMFYLTNFGYYTADLTEVSSRSESLDLFLNITLKRLITSTLMLNLIPIIIILMLLFLVLMLTASGILKIEHVLASIASLFFTIMLAYNRFYEDIPVQYNVFLGSFYQMVEVALFIVAIIAISYLRNYKNAILTYQNMLIPRLLFWPLVTGWCLMQSLLYFY